MGAGRQGTVVTLVSSVPETATGTATTKDAMSQATCISQEFRRKMELPKDKLDVLVDSFGRQMEDALNTPGSKIMFPTMVHVLPSGHEEGGFFAIDLGGTNFRVYYVELSEHRSKLEDYLLEECNIPEEYYICHSDELFLWMAKTHLTFAERHGRRVSRSERPVVGFCFSFPCEHHALDSGRLVALTKGFVNESAVGTDPVARLSAAYETLGQPMNVACLLNDSVATLCAARYFDPRASIGVILGTGTNACYVEDWSAIRNLPELARLPEPLPHQMVINTEWGNMSLEALESTEEDDEVEAGTSNAGLQAFEKRISGLFMGQIAAAHLARLDRAGGLLGGAAAAAPLSAFITAHLSASADDETPDLSATAAAVQEAYGLAPEDVDFEVRAKVQEVCKLVARRGARLTAAALTVLLRRQGAATDATRQTMVAVDGGLYSKFAGFRAAMSEALAELLGEDAAGRVEVQAVEHASSLGAAVLAAAAAAAQRT